MLEIVDNSAKTFLQACQIGKLEKVKSLVSEYCITNWTIYRHKSTGDTALHIAAREGHIDIVKYLCENWSEPEFKVNVTNFDTKSPMHEAAQFAKGHILQYLIEQGADIDPLKRADWTPLMLACTKKDAEAQYCIRKLLQCGADVSLRNKDGWTPFLIACRSGDPVVISLFLKRFPNCINDKSNNGRSPLHVAALHACRDVLNIIFTAKPDLLESRDSSGSTPLHESVKNLNFDATDYLLELGADIVTSNNVGQNILHTAASLGNISMIEYILSHNAVEVNAKDHFGITPLQMAERCKQIQALKILSNYKDL